MVLEVPTLFAFLGILTSRQMMLCKIFRTEKGSKFYRERTPHFLRIPIIFFCLNSIPAIIDALVEVQVITYIFVSGIFSFLAAFGSLGVYLYYTYHNRLIPNKVYSDFYSNIVSVIFFFVFSVAIAGVYANFPNWDPGMYCRTIEEGVRSSCFGLVTLFPPCFILARPCIAVWFKQTAYLESWETVHKASPLDMRNSSSGGAVSPPSVVAGSVVARTTPQQSKGPMEHELSAIEMQEVS